MKTLSTVVSTDEAALVASEDRSKGKQDLSNDESYNCKGKRHLVEKYRTKVQCNYCNKDGNRIDESRSSP